MTTLRVPRVVWLLGLVSLFMDLSSEMIHSLLPVFLTVELGVSMTVLGMIEGLAEGTASISKIFSGILSDRLGRRKPLVMIGYTVAAVTKPLFPLATSAGWVFLARFVDRIGKGIRGAPRDALVADVAPPEVRGAAFGLRQSLDTAGAFLGPLVAMGLMVLLADDFRKVFWIATLPALAAVMILAAGVKEPERHVALQFSHQLLGWRDLRRFPLAFWCVMVIAGVFSLARFSEAFLVVRASDAGLGIAWTPLALVVMNFAYVFSAYPAGRLSDRLGRVGLLAAGLAVLIAADLLLAVELGLLVTFLGIATWGLHMGLTQGLLSALVADTVSAELRATAYGVLNVISGLVAVLASALAGALWQWGGHGLTFYSGAGISAAALVALVWWQHHYHDVLQV